MGTEFTSRYTGRSVGAASGAEDPALRVATASVPCGDMELVLAKLQSEIRGGIL